MNCAAWEERIALHAGGDAVEGVETHLAECRECTAFWQEMRESVEALRSLPGEELDNAHYTAVRARVMAELERPRAAWRRLAWIAGVAALVIVALGWPRREMAIPDPPRIMAAIPSAPLVMTARRASVVKVRRERREPLVVKLQTSDPNIVIYWIAD
jgi:hypothetical protein